ncbi:MAG: MFS transporter [Candidatus Bipolaricaulaceae bacterium]
MLRVFVPLFMAVAAAMVGLGVIAPILPLYVREFGAGGTELGLVYAAFSISRTLWGPLFGRVSDRVGRRRMIAVGLGTYTAVSMLYVLAGNLWQIAAFRFLHGVASVLVTPIAQAYVGDLTPAGQEGRTMNLFYTSMFVGMALGPLLGGGLAQRYGLVAPFFAMGSLSLVALVGVLALVPEDRRSRARPAPQVPLREVLRSPLVWGIVVYTATRGVWRQGFNAFWPLLGTSAGHGEAAVGTVLTAYLVAQAIFQIPFGYLADRLPRLPQIAVGGMLAPSVLFFVPTVAGSLPAVLGCSFLIGVASALGRASVVALRTERGRTHGMGTLAGIQSSAFASGQSLGPVVAGVAHDLGGTAAPMYLGGALGVVGSLLAVWVAARGGEVGRPPAPA